MASDKAEAGDAGTARERERALVVAMFRMLSHDLRNPIASAKMAADGIARSKDLPDKVLAKARRAGKALERADQLLCRFADLRALVLQQPLPVDKREQPLKGALQSACSTLLATYQGQVQVQLEADGPGQWDGPYMAQALVQLVDNAAKHGQQSAPICVRLAQQRGQLCLEVRSQGGAPSEPQWLAAGRGAPFRADPLERAQANGWGMGLAFVRAVAEAHDGQLQVTSAPQEVCLRLQFELG
jgi:two-component system sensor histidine kinase KdpD